MTARDDLLERLVDQYGDPETGAFEYTNPDGPEAQRDEAVMALEAIRIQSEDCLSERMERITAIADHALASIKGKTNEQ